MPLKGIYGRKKGKLCTGDELWVVTIGSQWTQMDTPRVNRQVSLSLCVCVCVCVCVCESLCVSVCLCVYLSKNLRRSLHPL